MAPLTPAPLVSGYSHKFLNEEKKIDLGQSLISTDETLAKMKQKYEKPWSGNG